MVVAVASVLLILLGATLLLVAFVGCLLPILPGPPIALAALVCVALDRGWDAYSAWEWGALIALVALVTVLDYVVPLIGAKKYGASRAGLWMSVLGMIVGLLFFPPFGMLGGAFLGALLGEMMAGKEGSEALRPAWGVFVGIIIGTGLKLAVCGVIAYYWLTAAF